MSVVLAKRLSEIRLRRGSIVPYVKYDDSIYLMLGIDAITNEITDIGGGVKKYESNLTASIRELKEETKGLLNLSPHQILFDVAVIVDNETVIFHELTINEKISLEQFSDVSFHNKAMNEIKRLIWVDYSDFLDLLRPKSNMWDKIKKFYQKINMIKIKELL